MKASQFVRIAVVAVLAIASNFLVGCQHHRLATPAPSPPTSRPRADWPRTFTDDLGNIVTFLQPPQRIISLSPNLTEIVFLVGAGAQLIGRTDYCDFPPEALTKPTIGGILNPSLEKIVSLRPEVMLAARGSDRAFLQRLGELEIPVLGYDPQALDEMIALVERLGTLTGHEQQAREAAAELNSRRERVIAETHKQPGHKLRVLFVLSREPLFVAGATSFVDDMLRTCGSKNVVREMRNVDQNKPWPQVSREAVVAANPQVIIFTPVHGLELEGDMADLLARLEADSGWREVTAVKQRQVYTVADDLVTIPGPRLIDGLEEISRILIASAQHYGEQEQ